MPRWCLGHTDSDHHSNCGTSVGLLDKTVDKHVHSYGCRRLSPLGIFFLFLGFFSTRGLDYRDVNVMVTGKRSDDEYNS